MTTTKVAKTALLVTLPLGLATALILAYFGPWRRGDSSLPDATPDDPRLTFATPYRNVRPEVRYIGDAACAACHASHAETYRRHSMGRSFEPVARIASRQSYGRDVNNPFEALDRRFVVEPHGDRVVHKQVWGDGRGGTAWELEAEVKYAIGSGSHGRSYVVERDGWLTQSPVSWYAQKNIWDLSPGFNPILAAGRRVQPECLFCHCNYADHVEHTGNRYRAPIFFGESIGCERCHGPGELHARRRERAEAVEGVDDTIVNPKRLEPALREAVCEQCHLEGQGRVVRRGRRVFDYRPGLPLNLFWSVFVKREDPSEEHEAVSQVEQMHASRCFAGSAGRMGCTSCHNPHELPPPATKAAYYRQRCLACHGEGDCRETPPVRRAKDNDSCTACHMPRLQSADIVHTAITDHRVLRKPKRAGAATPPPARPEGARMPLAYFPPGAAADDDPEVARDLGIALTDLARGIPQFRQPLARLAVPPLRDATGRAPDDVAALEAKGFALWQQESPAEALEALEAVLARAPTREVALTDAAYVAEALSRYDKAFAYWERALAVNPWDLANQLQMARLCAQRARWGRAAEACRAALRLEPGNVATRRLLITCLIRDGDAAGARSEFDALRAARPDDAALARWYEEERRLAPGK